MRRLNLYCLRLLVGCAFILERVISLRRSIEKYRLVHGFSYTTERYAAPNALHLQGSWVFVFRLKFKACGLADGDDIAYNLYRAFVAVIIEHYVRLAAARHKQCPRTLDIKVICYVVEVLVNKARVNNLAWVLDSNFKSDCERHSSFGVVGRICTVSLVVYLLGRHASREQADNIPQRFVV